MQEHRTALPFKGWNQQSFHGSYTLCRHTFYHYHSDKWRTPLGFKCMFTHNLVFGHPRRSEPDCYSFDVALSILSTVTQYIDLLAFVVSWNSLSDKVDDLHRAPRLVKFVNHTSCGCQCITKPSECNPATQQFVEDNCRCECRVQSKRCPRYQVWNPVQCKCICNPPQYVYCPRRFEWNREKCSCVCKNTTCRANKVKNHRNCRCYCSKKLPPCGQGLVRSRRDCKCRPRYSDN